MDPSDMIQLIILVVLLLLSAFFSSAETALTTVNKIRMRTLAESGDRRAERVLRVTDNSGKMLSAILIGNNIVNLSASSLSTFHGTSASAAGGPERSRTCHDRGGTANHCGRQPGIRRH